MSSKWLDLSDAIATRLGDVAALAGVDIIVDRQKDLATEVNKAVAKAKGAAIVILWAGSENEDEAAGGPRLACDYEITVVCRPVIRGEATPADELVEAVCKSLHHWLPEAGGIDSYQRMIVRRVGLFPDTRLLVHQIDARITLQL